MVFLIILAAIVLLVLLFNHRSVVSLIPLVVLLLLAIGVLSISIYKPDKRIEYQISRFYVQRIIDGNLAIVYLSTDGPVLKKEMPVVISNTEAPYVKKIVNISNSSFWKLPYKTVDFELVTNFNDYKKILERREP